MGLSLETLVHLVKQSLKRVTAGREGVRKYPNVCDVIYGLPIQLFVNLALTSDLKCPMA